MAGENNLEKNVEYVVSIVNRNPGMVFVQLAEGLRKKYKNETGKTLRLRHANDAIHEAGRRELIRKDTDMMVRYYPTN